VDRHRTVIVGAGNAGISLAARLLRDGGREHVMVVDGRQVHRYRPLLNYVGAGQATMARLERPMRDVVPAGCQWLQEDVTAVDPTGSQVITRGGRTLSYSTLVLCPGLSEDWAATPGLRDAYDSRWAASTFLAEAAPRVWPTLRSLRAGTVVFTVPPEPAPCGPTALKPLLMACDHWRRHGVLQDIRVQLILPTATPVGLPGPDAVLEDAFSSYGVDVLREARVESLDPEARRITLATGSGRTTVEDVEFAHVVPHYRAPDWIAASGLSDTSSAGLVDVDPETMRHRRHEAIWALGDVGGVTPRPSGGALRKQVDVLADNLQAVTSGGELRRYDGYTVMPITVSRRRLLLVEVDREGRPVPSVPIVDLTKPRRITWWFDRYVLPVTYFRRILRGRV
jgi:sulfide:quinone oxidoreductase